MGKLRCGGYVFITWKGDHPPRHVHDYRDGKLFVKWAVQNPITELFVDKEAGREAFTYALHSGRSGIVHVEQVLEYHQDPTHLRDLLLDRLTLEAQKGIAAASQDRPCVRTVLDTCMSTGTLARMVVPNCGRDSIVSCPLTSRRRSLMLVNPSP